MRSSSCRACLAAILLAASFSAAAGAGADSRVGMWMTRTATLHYRATTTRYACNEIRSQVIRILSVLGASPEVTFREGCTDFDLLQRLDITAMVSVDATRENIDKASAYDAERELIYRLRGETPPPMQFFFIESRKTELFKHPKLRLQTGDCELVASLEGQIFPTLGITNERRRVSCSFAPTSIRPRASFVSLFPASSEPDAEFSS